MTVEARIEALLDAVGAAREALTHRPVTGAADAADARGTALAEGGKALLLKAERLGFVLLALPGDARLDGRALRAALRVQRYRLATAEELLRLTGLAPGCVPPFGRPVFDLPLWVDAALAARPRIVFTPGRPDRSLRLATADWLAAARPDGVARLS